MALGTRIFKIHSVSHFAMILSLVCRKVEVEKF